MFTLMNAANMNKFKHHMDSVIDLDFVFRMCQTISISNKNLISQILKYKLISYSEIELQLVKLYQNLYIMPIESDHFTYVFNSLLTFYLKDLIDNSLNYCFSKHSLVTVSESANIKTNLTVKIMSGLHDCFVQNFCYKSMFAPVNIEHIVFNVSDKSSPIKSQNNVIVQTRNSLLNVLPYTNLNPFLSLGQDYSYSTKVSCSIYDNDISKESNVLNQIEDFPYSVSSKNKEIIGKVNRPLHFMITSTDSESDNDDHKNYNVNQRPHIQKPLRKEQQKITVNNSLKTSVRHLKDVLYLEKRKIDSSYSKHSCVLQNYIDSESDSDSNISKQEKFSKKRHLKNNRRKLALDYSLKALSGEVRQEINCVNENEYFEECINVSDSDDSIVFSEDFIDNEHLKKESCVINKHKQKLHCDLINNNESSSDDDNITHSVNYSDESESDDSIIFSSNYCENIENLLNLPYNSNNDNKCEISENVSNSQKTDENLKNHLKVIKFDRFIVSDDDSCTTNSTDDNSDSSGSFDLTDFSFNVDEFSENEKQMDDFFSSKCFGYDNICFENNEFLLEFDHIRNINKSWDSTMKDVSDEPREAKRVSFLPLPELVSIQEFEPDNDGYRYSLYVLEQIRFQNRIKDFEVMMTPYLNLEHRAKFYQKYYLCEEEK